MRESKNRLLMFDLLKIVAILLIVLAHVGQIYQTVLVDHYLFYNFYDFQLGVIGVSIFLFASGALLEINKKSLDTLKDIIGFYVKRVLRIYPAYWMALFLALILEPHFITDINIFQWPIYLAGMTIYFGMWGGHIIGAYWFIGLIITMYLLYPFISSVVNKWPWPSLIIFALLSFGSRYLIYTYLSTSINDMSSPFYALARWLPICNLFIFGLGIFVVNKGYYFKYKSNRLASFGSDLGFYVFLTHGLFLNMIGVGIPLVYLVFYCIDILTISVVIKQYDERLKLVYGKNGFVEFLHNNQNRE